MPDDLRFCASRCCYFVNNRPTTRIAYELTAHAYELGLNMPEPDETIVPCRWAAGRLQYAIENTLGFYIGFRLPRRTGVSVLESKNPLIFDRATGAYLRVATDDDIRRWDLARRQLSSLSANLNPRLSPHDHTVPPNRSVCFWMGLRSIRIDSEQPASVQKPLPRLLSQALTRSIPRGALMRASSSSEAGSIRAPRRGCSRQPVVAIALRRIVHSKGMTTG
jgi:hypothetical protein